MKHLVQATRILTPAFHAEAEAVIPVVAKNHLRWGRAHYGECEQVLFRLLGNVADATGNVYPIYLEVLVVHQDKRLVWYDVHLVVLPIRVKPTAYQKAHTRLKDIKRLTCGAVWDHKNRDIAARLSDFRDLELHEAKAVVHEPFTRVGADSQESVHDCV